ncbi:MAG: molecular chaperone TorD family protein [Elusimicrobia bacterium]|nr:molecular chaperone TorD family protein [Elusimicrobiota bacterium]
MSALNAGPAAALAALLEYPGAGFRGALESALGALSAQAPAAAAALEPFAAFAAASSDTELEEAFTHTFDLNPSCALEIGWHLYGENYKRGEFLVEMRRLMRRLEVPEDKELPDHLSHVLAVLPLLETEQARELAEHKLLPALARIRKAAAGRPYDGVLRAIEVFFEGEGLSAVTGQTTAGGGAKGVDFTAVLRTPGDTITRTALNSEGEKS